MFILFLFFAGGFALGLLYFGGLWWTTSQVWSVRVPELWLVISFLVRIAMLLGVLFLVLVDGWQRLVLCMVGILVARTVLIRWAGRPSSTQTCP